MYRERERERERERTPDVSANAFMFRSTNYLIWAKILVTQLCVFIFQSVLFFIFLSAALPPYGVVTERTNGMAHHWPREIELDERSSAQFLRTLDRFRRKGEEEDREGTVEFKKESYMENIIRPTKKPTVKPCKGITKNTTVITLQGKKVLCLVPTESELMTRIKAIGGYNRRYVAPNESETRYFVDLTPSAPTFPTAYDKVFFLL